MATATLVSIDEYLRTMYDPDMEFVDGVLKERAVVMSVHGLIQSLLATWFTNHGKEWGIKAAVEVRTRVSQKHVRLPDVVVGLRRKWPETLVEPPLIVIEVISPSDAYGEIEEKIAEYQAMGIPNIWLIHPTKRLGWTCNREPWVPTERFQAVDSPIYVDLATLFAELDESDGE